MGAKVVKLKDVWAMLDHCAPGHERAETDHYWRITYGARFYPNFPTGKHGARKSPEIEAGHVRSLVRHLGIEPCARQQLRGIYAG